MKSLPLVSVIIPTHNRARFLVRAIESVLNQTYPLVECIVVDDGSGDETPHLVTRYPLKYLRLSKNLGVSVARNRGILKAGGELIAFLDSDDWYLPRKLERQVEFLQRNPQYKAVQTEEIWLRRGRRVNPKRKHAKARDFFLHRALDLCVVSPSTVMLRREVFAELGFFREDFSVCEDYEFFIRFALRYPMGYLPEALVVKEGGHPGQLSSRWGLDFYRFKALIINYARNYHQLKPFERLLFLYQAQRKAEIFAQGAKKRGNLPGLFELQVLYQRLLQRWEL